MSDAPEDGPGQDSSDLDIVEEVLRGDTDRFRLLVVRYQGLLFRLAFSYLHDREAAADAVQDIFLRAFRFLPKFRRSRKFLPWLYTIAVNQLRTSHRRARLSLLREAALDAQPEPAGHYGDPVEQFVDGEEAGAVRSAIGHLPSRLRGAAELYFLQELSVSEVAALLGLTAENVKSRLSRARGRLREWLLHHRRG